MSNDDLDDYEVADHAKPHRGEFEVDRSRVKVRGGKNQLVETSTEGVDILRSSRSGGRAALPMQLLAAADNGQLCRTSPLAILMRCINC
jgi:hypothetical protein